MRRKQFLLFIWGVKSNKWLYVSSFKKEAGVHEHIYARMFHPANQNLRYQIRIL